MQPSKEWLAHYRQKQGVIRPLSDLNAYFDQAVHTIAGKAIDRMSLGPVSLPSGQLLVRDPLVYLSRAEAAYFLAAPPGEYEAVACVVKPDDDDCARYAAVRVCFTDQPATVFTEALIGHENLETLQEAGDFFGFNVDAGLATIADTVTRDAFCDFSDAWRQQHPGGNLYDDYFAALFAESYRQQPRYQRSDGDWINWRIPGTDYRLPFFQSGFGDGAYPAYFGFDAQGALCQLVIEFIAIELAYEEEAAE